MKDRTDFCTTCSAEVALEDLHECINCNTYYCDYCRGQQGEYVCECAEFRRKDERCNDCINGVYPYYGVAPHVHERNGKPVAGKDVIGSTKILAKDKWPENFVQDMDGDNPNIAPCGIYYCPVCG